MPNFVKSENVLDTRLDQWLYFLKNLENFQDMPKIFKDELFEKAFDKAELANLDQLDLDQYESSLKVYRDLKGVIDTAFEDGLKEGIEQGIEQEKREIAKMLKVRGLDISEISSITGLSQKEIEDF
jgi:predicted transposase/invertase (TIGR01784 family)